MDHFSKVLLAIDNAHISTEGPGLWTRLRSYDPLVWVAMWPFLAWQAIWPL